MSNQNDFNPNWASTPGDTIADILNEKKLSISDFSKMMNSSISEVNNLLHGYILINESIAQKLNKCIGGSTDFWLRRESQYRSDIERLKGVEHQKWLKLLPVNFMVKNNWIEKENGDVINSLLKYFSVPDVWTWRRKYSDVLSEVSFRKSEKILSKTESLLTWLRKGEIQAEAIACATWSKEKFIRMLPNLKSLSRLKNPKAFLPKLIEECSKCGVAVAVAPTPTGCAASGLAKFLHPDKALILLSFRYKSDDQFWFTFFHEAAHIILHGETKVFIEEENMYSASQSEEDEANQFAAEALIPKNVRELLFRPRISEKEIKEIARQSNVSLGIVVGQLQFQKLIPNNYFNTFKKRYDWNDIHASLT